MAVDIRDRSAWAASIGERVRAARLDRGWSQEKLGRETEFSRVTIDRVEKGKSLAGVDTLAVIAESLELSVMWLLYGEEDASTPGREHIREYGNPAVYLQRRRPPRPVHTPVAGAVAA